MAGDDSLVPWPAKRINQQEQAKRPNPLLTDVVVSEDDQSFERLDEGNESAEALTATYASTSRPMAPASSTHTSLAGKVMKSAWSILMDQRWLGLSAQARGWDKWIAAG